MSKWLGSDQLASQTKFGLGSRPDVVEKGRQREFAPTCILPASTLHFNPLQTPQVSRVNHVVLATQT